MKERYSTLNISPLCGLFGRTRFAYYQRQSRQSNKVDYTETILNMIRVIRKEQPRLGTPKLYYLLKPNLNDLGIKMGRNKLNELIQNAGLGVKMRKRRYIRTTYSNHRFRKYPHLVQGFEPDGPHQLWVTDITFIPYIKRGFCFLTLITDAYSHKIVGYNLSKRMQAEDCIVALEMALDQLPEIHQLIHHSDRGTQFCSDSYTALLLENKIRISMTEDGNPKENPVAERINGILKNELELKVEQKNYRIARENTKLKVGVYNKKRPHGSCDFLTPEQAHQGSGKLKKRWKNYRKEYAIKMKKEQEAAEENSKEFQPMGPLNNQKRNENE